MPGWRGRPHGSKARADIARPSVTLPPRDINDGGGGPASRRPRPAERSAWREANARLRSTRQALAGDAPRTFRAMVVRSSSLILLRGGTGTGKMLRLTRV